MPNKLNLYKNALIGIKNSLSKSLSFDEKNFLQLFKDKLKGNLSESGKIIYDNADFEQSLKNTYKKFSDELTAEYLNLLDLAEKDALNTFDPHATVQKAQAFLQKKLNELNTSLSNNLDDELITKGDNFDEEDKEELNKVLNNYTDNCEKKLNTLLQGMEGVWPKVAKLQLHIRNAELELKAKDPNATFSINETDPDKLSIGIAPDPTKGFRIDVLNLVEQILHVIANLKPGQEIHIQITSIDKNGITIQVGENSIHHRNPAVGLFALALFWLLVGFKNNPEQMLKACKKIIEKYGIAINPDDIKYANDLLNSNGKRIVIKGKGPLEEKYRNELQQANQELRKNLNESEVPKATKLEKPGYESDQGYELKELSSDEKKEKMRNTSTFRR